MHKGDFMGIAPTNRQVMFTAIGIYQFDDGKLVEDWIEFDALGPCSSSALFRLSGRARSNPCGLLSVEVGE